ncbi:MAG: rod shape-determining protein MreC [Patescibacteria group bacterium]|jgi:rod shape-determining protein MreC
MTPVARSRLIILIVAAGGLLFFLHLLGATANAEAWTLKKLSGQEAKLAEAGRSLRAAISAPFRINAVLNENDALRAENADLSVEVARLTTVQEENEELEKLLGYAKQQKKTPVVARVLARTPEAGTHTILLDRGTDDGVAPDMPVVAADGVLIGKIFKAERTTSIALLLTDTRSRVGASVQNSVRTQGVVQGKRGLSLEMRLIPQNEELTTGDMIITSGIEPMTPRGLLIGRITAVETQEKSPFKTATISSPIALDRLDVVAIPFP